MNLLHHAHTNGSKKSINIVAFWTLDWFRKRTQLNLPFCKLWMGHRTHCKFKWWGNWDRIRSCWLTNHKPTASPCVAYYISSQRFLINSAAIYIIMHPAHTDLPLFTLDTGFHLPRILLGRFFHKFLMMVCSTKPELCQQTTHSNSINTYTSEKRKPKWIGYLKKYWTGKFR